MYDIVEYADVNTLGTARLCELLERLGRSREGDIRHCHADIGRIRSSLGFERSVALEHGVGDLADWARDRRAVDRAAEAMTELEARGLVR